MSQRTDRVDELLRQEIGSLLAKEVADPRIGFATITDVETSPDLRHAKVWVSVIGQEADRDETLRALAQAMGFIRHELGRRLRIRRIPDLHVRLDDSAERGTRVLHLLQELGEGVSPDEISIINESLPTPVKRLHHEGDAEAPEPPVDPDALAADGLVIPPAPRVGGKGQWRTGAGVPRGPRGGPRPGGSSRGGPRGSGAGTGGTGTGGPRPGGFSKGGPAKGGPGKGGPRPGGFSKGGPAKGGPGKGGPRPGGFNKGGPGKGGPKPGTPRG